MGQKVNPHGFRVGVIKDWDSRWYASNEKVGDLLVEDHKIRVYLKKLLYAAGVSKIEIERSNEVVTVYLHVARPGVVIGKGGEQIEQYRKDVEKLIGKTVKLNIVEVRNPDMDAQLVAENIAAQLEKRISHRRAMKNAMGRAMRAGAKGIKCNCGGRLGGREIAGSEHYHEGTSPLQTLRADIAYGFAAAAMLAAVVLWFSCWNTVMTSDKLMHLFGRVVPALSLLLSMTLRFVPRFQAKLREVTAARRGMGLYAEKGRLQKLKSAVTVFSVMVTWSLENAVETADSMKSRGYGLPGRTAFSLYRYSRRDRLLLLWLALCGAYVAAGWALGGVKWRYYPTARGVLTPYSASVLLAYFLLCLTPVLLQRKEARTWNSIASKA